MYGLCLLPPPLWMWCDQISQALASVAPLKWRTITWNCELDKALLPLFLGCLITATKMKQEHNALEMSTSSPLSFFSWCLSCCTLPLLKYSCTFTAGFCFDWVLPATWSMHSSSLISMGSSRISFALWSSQIALFKTHLCWTFQVRFSFSSSIFRYDTHPFDKIMRKKPAEHRHLSLSALWPPSHKALCFPTSPALW